MRILVVSLLASITALGVVSCGTADDGGSVALIPEYEPNDDASEALTMTGADVYYVRGSCNAGESEDWFVTVPGGDDVTIYFGVLEPDDGSDDPLGANAAVASVAVLDGQQQVLAEELTVAQGTRTELHASTSSTQVFFRVGCPSTEGLGYHATIEVP